MADLTLSGRVALVTGASRGIGRGIALALARAGADIAVNYRREAEAAAAVVAEISAMGRRAKAYHAPVDDFEACASMVDAVVRDFGGLSILINNAGFGTSGAFHTLPLDRINEAFDLMHEGKSIRSVIKF